MKHYLEAKNPKELCKLLGLPETEADTIAIRAKLSVAIAKAIDKHSLTHVQAAQLTGIGRTVITAVCNGNIHHISTERLIIIAQKLGLKVEIKVASPTSSAIRQTHAVHK